MKVSGRHVPVGLPTVKGTRRLGGARGELSYLAPLGSENVSAPYFKQCFFRGGGIPPPD